tara:strand:+ start:22106 stop:22966 length:861 start_codon:yes stop_codon:yes gene_type:complete
MEKNSILMDSIPKSIKDYFRGIAGGLLFSLPMLYTMELWWTGFIAGPLRLIIYLLVGLVLLLGYNHFVGIHRPHTLWEGLADAVEEMGLGLLITAFILWLLGILQTGMSLQEMIGKIVVEALTVAIGISVGKAQLGSSGENGERDGKERTDGRNAFSGDQLAIALCGSVLVAANVAPTEEIVQIALETSKLRLLLTVIFSFGIGGAILYYSDFKGSGSGTAKPRGKWDIIAGIVAMYTVSLVVSAFMLWFFGRFQGASLDTILAETVVLALPAALGASAGRLLLQA